MQCLPSDYRIDRMYNTQDCTLKFPMTLYLYKKEQVEHAEKEKVYASKKKPCLFSS